MGNSNTNAPAVAIVFSKEQKRKKKKKRERGTGDIKYVQMLVLPFCTSIWRRVKEVQRRSNNKAKPCKVQSAVAGVSLGLLLY